MGPVFSPFPMGPPVPRRSPYNESVMSEKHRRIYPTEFELDLIQKTVRSVETGLKGVSDMISNKPEATGDDVQSKEATR